MASFTPSQGIRIFSGTSVEAVEDAVNTFMAGSGTIDNRRKQQTQDPQFVESGGVFYVLISYIDFGD